MATIIATLHITGGRIDSPQHNREVQEWKDNGNISYLKPFPRHTWNVTDDNGNDLQMVDSMYDEVNAAKTWISKYTERYLNQPLTFISLQRCDDRFTVTLDHHTLTDRQRWMFELVKATPGRSQHYYAVRYAKHFEVNRLSGFSMLQVLYSNKNAIRIDKTNRETTGSAYGNVSAIFPVGS